MIELPESKVFAKLGTKLFKGLEIVDVKALSSPHKFCWMNEKPDIMEEKLLNKKIKEVKSSAHYLRFMFEDGYELACAEDVMFTYQKTIEDKDKHQLALTFDNGYSLLFKVKLYGFIVYGIESHLKETMQYYKVAVESIDPLSKDFTFDYFLQVTDMNEGKGSVKQALATNQHIPGLGNGILQDILFQAKMNPKRKINTLSDIDKHVLYDSVIHTIDQMTLFNGRDSVVNFVGEKGSYEVLMKSDRNTCPICQSLLKKEAYLGGKVIYCPSCQK
ncbi:MAG: hypothetical protein EP317_04415 [Bacillota bacterium]|nr:MAG: hypothetical protein EP317_04415 [Bacillota bacterium]